MSEEIQGFRFRASTRVAFGEKVRLRFDRGGQPLLAVCSDLSIEGMFVATHDLRPLGTVVEFEIEGRDDEVARGLGDVVWARKEKVGPGRYAGMGVQFRYVDPSSRALIAQMVERRRQEAGDENPGEELKGTPKPGSDVGGPVVSDKTLAGISAGAMIAAAARGPSRPAPAPDPLMTENVVLAGRGGGTAAPASPAPAAPVALDGEGHAAEGRGFPWLPVVFVLLVVAAGAAAWWVWFSDRAPSVTGGSTSSGSATPAATRRENVPVTSGPAAGGSSASLPDEAPSSPVEVRSVSVLERDDRSALVAVELSRLPGGDGVRVSRLESPARVLVRIPDVEVEPTAGLLIDTPLVSGLRAALHREGDATELHLVFDLADDRVRAESRLDGERLLLRLSNG